MPTFAKIQCRKCLSWSRSSLQIPPFRLEPILPWYKCLWVVCSFKPLWWKGFSLAPVNPLPILHPAKPTPPSLVIQFSIVVTDLIKRSIKILVYLSAHCAASFLSFFLSASPHQPTLQPWRKSFDKDLPEEAKFVCRGFRQIFHTSGNSLFWSCY